MSAVALKFVVSAPGKVILFGEHSVVYGKPAVAASINKRSTIHFEANNSDALDINLFNVNLCVSVPLNVVQKILDKFTTQYDDTNTASNDTFCEYIIESLEIREKLERNQKISIFCLFYLLHKVSTANETSVGTFKISVSSDIVLGAGTGSSASFSVCLAAAFYHYFRVVRSGGDGSTEPISFSAQDKRKINDYAFTCEQIIHGQASGLDNFVCTFGSIIEVTHEDSEGNNRKAFRPIENVDEFRILLINTGVSRSTAKMVQNVRDLRSRNTAVVDAILDAMGTIAKSACLLLVELRNEYDKSKQFQKLEELISLNHGLLATLGVSHSTLDTIVEITKKYDLHSKLTGAGGGGYAFTLIPPDLKNDVIQKCKCELEANGFLVDDTNIGGNGVEIELDL